MCESNSAFCKYFHATIAAPNASYCCIQFKNLRGVSCGWEVDAEILELKSRKDCLLKVGPPKWMRVQPQLLGKPAGTSPHCHAWVWESRQLPGRCSFGDILDMIEAECRSAHRPEVGAIKPTVLAQVFFTGPQAEASHLVG